MFNKRKRKLYYIGKLDKNKLGKYKNKIKTDEVILTEERRKHIYYDHLYDYEKIMTNIKRVVLNPNEILEDLKNEDTLFFIDKLENNNLNVIVRLNTKDDIEHPKNSIMTAWIVRDKNLKKIRKKNKNIYKNE